MACAGMYYHLQLLAKPLNPALGLLQGLASHLSIAHTHQWLLEVTLQDLIQQKEVMKRTYQATTCNKLGLLTCC